MQGERQRVVDAARTWLDTPYHHHARLKGVGVDCAQILIAVFAEAGLVEPFETGYYPPDWMMHREAERYLGFVTQYCPHVVIGTPQPGDIAVWRIGRCFAHGGIITEWPHFIHAYLPARKVCYGSADDGDLANRARLIYSFWES
jgi:cell wall-associated NlpC family hydrolase